MLLRKEDQHSNLKHHWHWWPQQVQRTFVAGEPCEVEMTKLFALAVLSRLLALPA